jgi:hypothetical protein
VPSFSSLFTSLTGGGFYYSKSPRHATYNFNQDAQSLYRNQPRVPFEYYVNINLNQVGTAKEYVSKFFNSADLSQIAPLVKSVEMPSMKIATDALNQYNRKRLSQSVVTYEPIKMVFHDVADGKTLKFWEMYYRYYFADGFEPDRNGPKAPLAANSSSAVEQLISGLKPKLNSNLANLPASVKSVFTGKKPPPTATNTSGEKSILQNIVSNQLDNHNFGYNLPQVQNERNLIESIEIFQVHGGRYNSVTIVNPRISAFTHDVLNYAVGDKTLELTFTLDYEYAFYTMQNMKLGASGVSGSESNNKSSTAPFEHGEFLELPALAFNSRLLDFIESNNPLLQSDNPILNRIGKNVQSSIGSVTGAFLSDKVVRRVSASALDGLAKISPTPYANPAAPPLVARSFASAATKTSTQYTDVNRAVK